MPETPEQPDPYIDWMYAADYVLKTYDWDLIESHAAQMLSRSLNVGRVTAFVGAGTSMAYGRISWKNLVLTELRKVRAKADLVLGKSHTPDVLAGGGTMARKSGITVAQTSGSVSSGTHALQKLRATLQELDPNQPNVRSDRFPMIMQLCEEFDQQLTAEARRQKIFDTMQKEFQRPTRQRASVLTKDELGHAREILWNACFGSAVDAVDQNSETGEKLEETIFGLNAASTAEARTTASRLFSSDNLIALMQKIEPDIRSFPGFAGVVMFLDQLKKRDAALLPPQRFVFEALLCWLPADKRQEFVEFLLKPPEAGDDAKRPLRPGRSLIIPACRDPIRILHDELQITRYMTTNYDSEIEAFFEDIGFASTLPGNATPGAEQISTTRSRVSTFVSDTKTIGKFLAFVARPRSRSVHIVHLHGRSMDEKRPEEEKRLEIVFAEVDYQRRYLQDFPERDLEQGATRLAFGANPVLFIGSNMGEDDLLRSLREFMSSKEPFGERVCVALVPATGHRDSCVEDKIALLVRYGVYVIHFGTARMSGSTKDVLWLPWQRDVAGAAEAALSKLCTEIRKLWGDDTKPADANVLGNNLVDDIRAALRSAIEQRHTEGFWSIKPNKLYRLEAELAAMEGIEMSTKPDLSVAMELETLNGIIDFLLSFDPGWAMKHAKAFESLCTGYLAAVKGLGDSILSAFSCAALLRLRQKWDGWREDWFKEPEYRDARKITALQVNRGKSAGVFLDGYVTLTHSLRVEHDHGGSSRGRRFFAGKTSRSLLGLISALQGARTGTEPDHGAGWIKRTGRRFLWLATRRGAGKGQFFSVFQARLTQLIPDHPNFSLNEAANAVRSLLQALAPNQGFDGSNATVWGGIAFFNLAFAHDVQAVFDRLEKFLRTIAINQGIIPPDLGSDASNKHGRLAAMREILGAFAQPKQASKRVLIAFNSMENLFDSCGRAKNGELKKILDIITDPFYASAPIDFMFVVDDRAMGHGFCHNPILLHFDRADATKCFQEKAQLGRFVDLPNVPGQAMSSQKQNVPESAQNAAPFAPLGLERPPPAAAQEHAVFFIRTTPALLVLGAYFPRLALFLLHAKLQALQREKKVSPYEVLPNVMQNEDLKTFVGKTLSHYLDPPPEDKVWLRQERVWMQSVLATVVTGLPCGVAEAGGSTMAFIPAGTGLIDPVHFCNAAKRGQQHMPLGAYGGKDFSAWWLDIGKLGEALDKITQNLYVAVGRNRYLVTLVLAAASYFVASRLDEGNATPAEIGTSAEKFLRDIGHEASAGGAVEKSSVVIEHVLRSYRVRQDGQLNNEDRPFSAGADGFNLCLEIIWHAAIVGRPVQASVLLACPGLRLRIDSVIAAAADLAHTKNSASDNDPGKIRLDYLRDCLKSCVERGFLFEISPVGRLVGSGEAANGDDGSECRYAVHHLMQRYIFKQMGGPNAEAIVGNQFAVSLFASQPDEMPSLDSAADANIRKVIASLTGYPDQDNLRSSLFQSASRVQASRMLRAAHGIMRSIYSVGVLARFDAANPSASPRVGVMEQYRRLVRWTLKATVDLPSHGTSETIEANPFHSDEVVWLYNEMGVLSLVQGRLADGDAMLSQALQLLRTGSEPEGLGPSSNRIHVNKALLDIERGHFGAAQTALREVCRLEDEHGVVHAIAVGYLGLIAHFSGNATEARQHYQRAVEALGRLDESRACALFHRHWGDLSRSDGPAGFDDSQEHLQEALRMAQRGRHEDVRHMVMLSLARLSIERGDPDRRRNIHPDLDEVDRYAQLTGMVRLGCEVALLRALLLMREGETRMASVECLRSLQIAAAYDMRLRAINATLLLAEICAARKLWPTAAELLEFASISARSLGDQSAVAASQRIKRLLPIV